MTEHILNILPLRGDERAAFEQAAPDASHDYARRSTVTPEQLAQATIILGCPKPADLAHAGKLKWMHSMWAGVDDYIREGVLAPETALTSSAGFNSQSVAEHMLAGLLALCRKLPLYRDNQNRKIWHDEGELRTISEATVLVVGAGNIGQAFATRCQALGGYTVGFRRTAGPAPDGFCELHTMDELDSWLPRADVVALALPNSPNTTGLMSRERFALLKDGAMFVNAGRGATVDQDALLEGLTSGKIWGAMLDVATPEPLPADSPLWEVPNLLITPHVGGGMQLEMNRRRSVEYSLDNLRRYVAGEPLRNVVRNGDLRPYNQ